MRSFSGPYFTAFGLNTERYVRDTRYGEYLSVFSPNMGKYGPEKTPYLDTFTQCSTAEKGLLTVVTQLEE